MSKTHDLINEYIPLEFDSFSSFFDLFIDSLPFLVMICEAKADFKIIKVNALMAKSLGKTKEELIGNNVLDYFPKKVAEIRKKHAEAAVKTNKPSRFIDERNGRFFSNEFYTFRNKNEEVIFGLIIVRDITTEKKAEQKKLQHKELYYESLIENSMDLITVIDNKGTILYESNSLKNILGFKASDRIGKKTFEHIHPDDIERVRQYFNEIIQKPGLTSKLMYRIKDAKNKYHYFESIGNNQLKNNIIKGLIVNSRDATEQQKFKETLSKQKRFLDNMVNSTCEIIFTVDRNHEISLWNEAATQNTGHSKKTVVGRKLKLTHLFENQSEIHNYLQAIFSDKDSTLRQLIVNSSIGGKRLWSVSASAVKSEGIVTDVVFVCQDITHQDQVHGRLIPGKSYIIYDASLESLINIFKGLTENGWKGFFITRKIPEEYMTLCKEPQATLSLYNSFASSNSPSSFLKKILEDTKKFITKNKQPIICLDRIDYLIARFDFNEVLNFLYHLNDIIRKQHALLLVRFNRALISSEQLGYLSEEFSTLPSQQINDVYLEDFLYNILDYIFKENSKNVFVSQKHICSHFSISKATAQKRIEHLHTYGLIISQKHGRSKFLYVSDKGKELLRQRKAI